MATNNNTATIVNGVRSTMPAAMQASLPVLKGDLSNINDIATAMKYTAVANSFLENLTNRIGLVKIEKMSWEDPFTRVFTKGTVNVGSQIETIFVDLAKSFDYNWKGNTGTEAQLKYSREVPDVKALYINLNVQKVFKTTITQQEVMQAFTSANGVEDLVNKISASLYTSLEVFKYEAVKNLLKQAYTKNYFKKVEVPEITNTETLKGFAKTCRSTTRKMTFPSNDKNAAQVTNASKLDKQYILINPDLEADMDVNLLSYAFNINFSKLKPEQADEKVMIVDAFPAGMENVYALIVDEDFFMIYNNLMKTETSYNEALLYWNIFLHYWAFYNVNGFAQAIAIEKAGA